MFLPQCSPFYLRGFINKHTQLILYITYKIYFDIIAWQFDNMFRDSCDILYGSSLNTILCIVILNKIVISVSLG